MKSIDVNKLRSDMNANGYNNTRLSQILRCSESTITNILSRGSIKDSDLPTIEAIFGREEGYYDSGDATSDSSSGNSEELYKLIAKFNTDVFSYQMSHDKELRQLNETAQLILACLNEIKKGLKNLEGVSNNNTAKVTTAIQKVRTDTEGMKSGINVIARELKP